MHVRARVRLSNDERFRLAQKLHDLRRDRSKIVTVTKYLKLPVAQQAEATLTLRQIICLIFAEEIIAYAKEREIVRGQPFEKLDSLGDFIDRNGRRVGLEVRDDIANPR